MSKTIETDLKTFIKFWLVPLGIVLIILFCQKASTALIIIGISIFLALALRPLVRKVDNFFVKHFGAKKRQRTSSVILVYLLLIVIVGLIAAIIGPVIVEHTSNFFQQLPITFEENLGGWEGINKIGQNLGIENLQAEIYSAIEGLSTHLIDNFGSTIVSGVSSIADGIIKIVLIIILTLLFLIEGPALHRQFWHKIESSDDNKYSAKQAHRIITRMANVVSTYVSRQIFVAVIDGLASTVIVFILTLIFQIPTSLAIPMGLTTAIFYLIPMFGQFIGGTIVTIILLFSNPIAALVFAIIYIVYAQIENNLISPKIHGNALKLSVVVVLCALIIGMYMFGFIGALIAVPIAGCIRIFIDEYPNIIAAKHLDK